MIYVYAITDRGDDLPAGLLGHHDCPVWATGTVDVAALCSSLDGSAPPRRHDSVYRHERVVEQLMVDRAVLPARFGTLFRCSADLTEALGAHRDELLAGLDSVRGLVEVGVRALWHDADAGEIDSPRLSSDSLSGREYMTARLARERTRIQREQELEALCQSLHAPLAALAQQSTWRWIREPLAMFAGAYLVGRDQIDRFRRGAQETRRTVGVPHILCTGPWPPYHFVPSLKLVSPHACGSALL